MTTKEFQIQLNGGLDTRSADGACVSGWFRLLLNIDGSEPFQMCCLGGWQRRMADAQCVNNQDLHDQMVETGTYQLPYSYTTPGYSIFIGTAYYDIPIYQNFPEVTTEECLGLYYLNRNCREAITFIKSVTSVSGARRLLAGTHSRLYASDDAGGNWRIIADGLGGECSPDNLCTCSSIRMSGATLGNYTILTNNTDEVLVWQFDIGPAGCYGWSADYVQELRELNLVRASGVTVFQGITILWDVTMDNQDYPNRMLWSDYNAPLSWIPGGESIAGFLDLALGERIIICIPMGGRLRVITNQAVYMGQAVQDERVLVFTEVYRLQGGVTSSLPAFRNGIAICGSFQIWVGQDDIYAMEEYDTSPQIVDWLHRASGVIFKGISENWVNSSTVRSYAPVNRKACDQVIARWSGRRQCVIVSWPTGTSVCPDLSLFIWPETHKASIVDYGFTDVVEHQNSPAISWRDYMGQIGICNPVDFLLPKEGESCPVEFTPREFSGLWNATEDTSLPRDPNSWSAVFCGVCMSDLCKSCEADTSLVLASASDKTLKEFTPSQYFREELVSQTDEPFPEPNLGEYVQNSYPVMIQADAEQREGPSEKTFRAMLVAYTAADATVPPVLVGSAGGGWTPGCLDWEVAEGVTMQCGVNTPTQRGGVPAKFSFMTTGSWLAWRITTTSADFCAINLSYRMETGSCW